MSMHTYNKLSTHLSSKLTDNSNIIEEGLFDDISKKMSNYLTSIGNIFSKLTGNDDKITKKLRELEAKALENEEKRQKDFIEAQEEELIAKLGADFAQRENQLDLENERKVTALRNSKKRLEADAKRWEKNKTMYSQEQLDAAERARQEEYDSLSGIERTNTQKINSLTLFLTTKTDGTIRTKAEIDALKNPDNKSEEAVAFRENLTSLRSIVKKNESAFLTAIDNTETDEYTDKFITPVGDLDNARTNLENLEQEADEITKKMEAVKKYKADVEAYETAVTERDKAKTAKQTAESTEWVTGDTATNIFTVDSNGNVGFANGVKKDQMRAAITAKIKNLIDSDSCKDEQGNVDPTKLASEMEKLGIPTEIIDKVKASDFNDPGKVKNSVAGIVETNITDENLEDVKESIKDKKQQAVAEAIAVYTQKEAAVPTEPTKPKYKTKVKDAAGNETEEEVEMDAVAMASFDPDQEPGKSYKTKIEDEIKEARNKVHQLEKETAARKNRRAEAVAEIERDKMANIPNDIKADVKKRTQGIEFGEHVQTNGENAGKVGVTVDGKFYPKPGPSATSEEVKEYEKQRGLARLQFDPTKKPKYVEIKYEDGKYYKKKEDGTWADITRDEAITIYAANQNNIQKAENKDFKEELAKKLKNVIRENGTIDQEQFNKLSTDQKAAIEHLLDNPDNLDEYLKDIDGTTVETIKASLSRRTSISADDFEKGTTIEGTKEGDKKVTYVKDSDGKFYKVVGEGNGAEKKEMQFDEWIEAVEQDKEASKDMAAILDGDMEEDDFKDTDHDEGHDNDEPGRIRTDPHKIWRPYKYKRGDKTIKSNSTYVNKKGDKISKKEFDKRCESYNRWKSKQSQRSTPNTTPNTTRVVTSFNYINLGNHLFESIGNTTNKYSKLRDCILNKLNS